MTGHALTFAVVLPALLVAHQVADHWAQTSHQAAHKGDPGWPGRWACLRHVASYTATTAAVTALLWAVLDLRITLTGYLLGQAVSALMHYWADRRVTLARLATWAGRGELWQLGQPRTGLVVVAARHASEVDAEGTRWNESTWADGTDSVVPLDRPVQGTGAYALDQSWHAAWLMVAALLTAVIA